MRILLVNRYFGSEQVPTGRMAGDLAEELLRRGHEVRAFTSSDSYVHSDPHAPGRGEAAVTRLWTGGRKRLVSWVLFWLQVCLRLPLARWDRCVVLTDPPFMVFSALPARIVGGR